MRILWVIVLVFISSWSVLADDLPALPLGLSDEEPSLPMGLDETEEPELPSGLFEDEGSPVAEEVAVKKTHTMRVNGFVEARLGARLQSDPNEDSMTLAEVRLQLQSRGKIGNANFRVTGDLLLDAQAETQSIDLVKGEGVLDLREVWVAGQLGNSLDYKIGRQIATWGTGDFLFINDLFPKNYKSFLLGRDDEYLKAPMNSIRLSYFSNIGNLDLVYTPEFAPDRYISGERLSYYNSTLGTIAGQNAIVDPRFPAGGELALRANRLVGSAEISVYYYHGYWKSPAGQNAVGETIFPKLETLGASWRQPLLGGIAYAELGFYDSKDDLGGNNPRIRNSEWRWLLGFEHELAQNLTGGFQIYEETMQDYGNYISSLPAGSIAKNKTRQVLTARITHLAMNQNLVLTMMALFSPTDSDYYLKPKLQYTIDDHWKVEMGGNIFIGKEESSFYGQFENNSNVYSSLRFSY